MAIQRYFETTQLRLRSIFDNRSLDEIAARGGTERVQNYFETLIPQYANILQVYDIIVGCLRFICDDLKVNQFIDGGLHGSFKFIDNTCIFNFYIHELSKDPVILKIQSFRSSIQPSISMEYKDEKINNICSGIYSGERFNMLYMEPMRKIIGVALYCSYKEFVFKGGKGKWEQL